MKVAIITGTRPEIIKLAPLIKELKGNSSVIFSGQHYDFDLSMRFFKELDLPLPDYKLKISKQSPAVQIGEII
ncbi:UDP-N-acetylglucosamine 2-epimerase [uncultured archaeon]|nr:UDP-N-acetylglucosamine 2-epimerase [uncultured archaeon]